MPILDAALAFALTMLVVATVVTQIVNLFQKLAATRRKELKKMLEEYFTSELKPVVEREMHRLGAKIDSAVSNNLNEAAKNFDITRLTNKVELEKLVTLSKDEWTEHLKRSDLGTKLLKDLGDQAQAVFDELGQRYEAVGDKFTESFRKHSRRWTTCVALVLAFVFNIDSIHILDSYIKNQTLRENVVTQMGAIVANFEATVASVEGDSLAAIVTKDSLANAIKDTQDQIELMKSSGFPIGWNYLPHACLDETVLGLDVKGNAEVCARVKSVYGWVWWWWLLGIFLTGRPGRSRRAVLVRDAVSGISRFAQKARGTVKKPTDKAA